MRTRKVTRGERRRVNFHPCDDTNPSPAVRIIWLSLPPTTVNFAVNVRNLLLGLRPLRVPVVRPEVGKKGLRGKRGDFLLNAEMLKILKAEIRDTKTLISVHTVTVCRFKGRAPPPYCGFRFSAGSSSDRPILLLRVLIENQDSAILQMDFGRLLCLALVEAIGVGIRWIT